MQQMLWGWIGYQTKAFKKQQQGVDWMETHQGERLSSNKLDMVGGLQAKTKRNP